MNILLTSAGRRTYMVNYFKQALGNQGKVFASNSILTYTLLQADEYVVTPNIYDKGYVRFLLDYCTQKEIDAIISLFDIDLPVLAKHKDDFNAIGVQLVVSNYDVTQICNDKWKTYQFLLELGLNQSPAYISLIEASSAISTGALSFPIFVKPRWGMGSIGIYKADNIEELNVLYRKLQREIFNTYLRFESAEDENQCIIIQQAIKGQEYGMEILNDLDGNYVATFTKKKIAMRSGETDIAITVDPLPFECIGKEISNALRHKAVLDVDFFMTEDNRIYILEMNCRFGGQYPFTHCAGVNIPLQIVQWLSGDKTDYCLLQQKNDIKSCKEISPAIY